MKGCKKCGKGIGFMQDYCDDCKKNLSLREKVINNIKWEWDYFKWSR